MWPVSNKFDQYLIFYSHVRNTVRVLRVRHAAQDLSRGF
jgi:plasmid stabilization system protein ParE